MAVTIKNLFKSRYWHEPRKYSKAEALLYLINRPEDISIRHLAMTWQWSKSSVERFLAELKREKLWDTFWDTFRDTKCAENKKVSKNRGTHFGTHFGTHLNKEYFPPILSSTKVESNIVPPQGVRESDTDFVKFQSWLSENAPRVAKMKEPFTAEQVAALKTDFDITFICDLLKAMHNYEPLLRKNRNANLTFRAWARREKQKNNDKIANTAGNAEPNEILRAVAEGISRARTPQEWQGRVVGI